MKRVGRRWLLRSAPLLALAGTLPLILRHTDRALAGTPIPGSPKLRLAFRKTDGTPFDLSSELGRVVLVYFGYTHCPDVCPTTLADLRDAIRQLADDARLVRVVFVTLDPHRDTGPLLADYLASFGAEHVPPFVGLVGSDQDVATAADAWDVTYRSAEGGAYFDHSSMVTMVGTDGRARFRYGYSQSSDPAALARDIVGLLHGA